MSSSSDEDEKDTNQEFATAIAKKDVDTMRELIVKGIQVNKLSNYGKSKDKITLLHYACTKKSLSAVKILIKFKADVNIQAFPSGITPLYIAAQWAHAKIVELLLDNGADPGITNNKGKAPLNVIGLKLGDKSSKKIISDKADVQLMILEATTKKAHQVQKELDTDILNAQIGLKGLKDTGNKKINNIQKKQGQKFDQMWPYMTCTKERLKVWTAQHGPVDEYLKKRYIKVTIPIYSDKIDAHLDFSRIQQFQLALAKELLLKGGLKLKPEPIPEKFAKKLESKSRKKNKKKN